MSTRLPLNVHLGVEEDGEGWGRGDVFGGRPGSRWCYVGAICLQTTKTVRKITLYDLSYHGILNSHRISLKYCNNKKIFNKTIHKKLLKEDSRKKRTFQEST